MLAIDPLFVPAQLDLALAVLCQGPVEAAANEYERGIELSEANEGGRGLSSLRVGLRDLREAVPSLPEHGDRRRRREDRAGPGGRARLARRRYAGELERIVAGVNAAQAPVG